MPSSQKMDVQFLVHGSTTGGPRRPAARAGSSVSHAPVVQPVRCGQCGKTYSLPGNLNKHMKTAHRNERPHKCQLCGTSFHFKHGLSRHIALIHSKESLPYRCETCGATFKQRSHLAKHENKTHRQPR